MTGLPQVGGIAGDAVVEGAAVAAGDGLPEASKPGIVAGQAPVDSGLGGRTGQLLTAILKNAHSREDGEKLLQELRALPDDRAIAAKLGLEGECTAVELADAFRRCPPHWAKNLERDVDWIVAFILEECRNMIEADRRFRALQAKIGRRLHGRGVLTEQVLNLAQSRCHEYWAKVTPGNVAFLVERVAAKSPDWPSADKKFDWLWKKGEWKNGRTVSLAGRDFSCEDLEQAERDVRRRFDISAKLPDRRQGSPANAAGRTDVGSTVAKDGAVGTDNAVTTKVRSDGAGAHKKEAKETNPDLIMRRVLGKCDSIAKAEKFFVMLRSNVGKPNPTGRIFSKEDVAAAWEKVKVHFEQAKAGDSSSSSGSSDSSDAEASKAQAAAADAAKRERQERKRKRAAEAAASSALGNVDFMVKHITDKFSSMNKAEKLFEKLHETVGGMSPLGRIFTEEEITEAWLRCSGEFEGGASSKKKKAAKGQSASKAAGASKKELKNTDYIVRKVIAKCDNLNKATKVFDMLQRTVGKPSPLGSRVFAEQEVTEAWLRVSSYFEESNKKQGEAAEDSSSSSESSAAPTKEKKPKAQRTKSSGDLEGKKSKKDKLKKLKSRGLVDDELEGVLFGSDSDDDVSGEESVDAEADDAAIDLADFAAEGEIDEQILDDGYPVEEWANERPEVLPGLQGFNERATTVMQRVQVGQTRLEVKFDAHAACPPLQPHQESVAFLMHPKSPISRLLVDHPTGSGKTREMIRVLENYFYDPRPKVPIFPKDPVCRNFYTELLRWPSRYRDYFCCEKPADAAIASGKPDWREYRFHMWPLSGFPEEEVRRLGYSIREVLEMKNMFYMGRVRKSFRMAFHKKHPGESMPVAPLRAIGYTSAGGVFSSIGETGRPVSAIMKIGFEKGSNNVYSNKVVLMDEAHNLVRTQTQYAEQLQRLRNLLFTAKNLVLAGFTGTPILNEPIEGRQLLDIIKGMHSPEGDEGFLSSFPMRPQPLFPISLPRGLPDGVLTMARRRQLIKKVELRGEALKMYDIKHRSGLPGRRLRAYCNVCTYVSTFHEGKHGTKIKVLTFPEDMCPKLFAIAQAVCASPEKAIIMTGRMSGHIVMLELMRFLAAKADPPFNVATMDELSEFNHSSNLRGEVYRVLVADAAQCSEGISFLAVRRTFLADVPVSPSAFIQQCGRAIRMYGHRGLPEDEQTVTNHLYVATLPKWMRTSSLSCWALRAQKKHTSGKEMEKRARVLTARLNRAGIKTLTELKRRIDEHGDAKRDSLHGNSVYKVQLTAEDVAAFLDQNGLWEEAKLLRAADKKDKEREDAAAVGKDALIQSIEDSQAGNGSLLHMNTMASFGLDRGHSLDDFEADDDLNRGNSFEDLEGEFEKALDDALDDMGELDGEGPSVKAPKPAARLVGAAPAVAAADPPAAVAAPEPVAATEPVQADGDASMTGTAANPQDGPAGEEPGAGAEAAPAAAAEAAPAADAAPAGEAGEGSPAKDPSKPELPESERMEPEAALTEAISVLKVVCKEMDKPAGKAGEEGAKVTWREQLESGLRVPRWSVPVSAALKAAVGPEFDAEHGDLTKLSVEQVKSLRDELVKLDRIAIIQHAMKVLKEVKTMIGLSTVVPETAVTGDANATAMNSEQSMKVDSLDDSMAELSAEVDSALQTAPASTPAADAAAEAAPAAVAAAEPVAADEAVKADAPAEAVAAAPADVTGEQPDAAPTPAVVDASEGLEQAAGADASQGAPAAAAGERFAPKLSSSELQVDPLLPEDAAVSIIRKQAEADARAWRSKLAEGLRDLRRNEHIRAALKVAAPALLEAADESLDTLTADHVSRLHDELNRLQEQVEKGGIKPRALVRAMQMLYLCDAADDGSLLLSIETADEEALRQLTERTEEFAPALAAMRSLAVDREIFDHLADKMVEEEIQEHSESEGSDLEAELAGRKEGAPVVLPQGWRLEWVKRKKREMREFVDPWGRRYYNVKEVRAALEEWEAMEARKKALSEVAAAREAGAAAEEASPDDAAPAAKRLRLRGKVSSEALPEPAVAMDSGDLEAAFEEALEDVLGGALDDMAEEAAAEPAAPATSSRSAAAGAVQLDPAPGVAIRLKGLMAKPELNDQEGRLVSFIEETGRWECTLADGSKVNVKPANFDVVAPPAAASRKRPAPKSASVGRQVRPRGRGRGRPPKLVPIQPVAAAAAGAAADSDSD